MLVITRRIGEAIIIDTGTDKIEIVLSEVRGKNARIGIQADNWVTIIRKELTGDDDAKRA